MSTPPLLPQPVPSVQAPQHWQRVDFISDLHLDAHEPATFEAWAQHMAHTSADAIFILGDLFEVWVGDDNQDPFALKCIAAIKATAQRMPVYFMCGNRDFLVGARLLEATGMQGLSDPSVLDLGSANGATPTRILLSHGDALCLDDQDYLAFRAQVRQPEWQATFLAKPLAERQAYARDVRSQSEALKRSHTDYADVDTQAAIAWLKATDAQILLHGHTHKPAVHDLGNGLSRWVLSDWHADAQPPRLEVLSWLRQNEQSPTRELCRLPLSVA
ncbi:MAG: UDP-2,3-diacylglucosamine diphosphatase [Burkholderiales bacterium 35-55-47]|jgi:UDP-2,3-diacylglucosamine hydrolase|uniref:UDP-2,3-diacylglucosamine diphosphatase n=1 Tax=Limnohabitans sp. TaxID=1907725 RepID=UPI000BC7331F|nr:UDP-2,3-diacylglucosamine diphosphatase [Limnohabitans sp.]OYY17473.1 MAG: UDP-2,3-diacylglucosamine diphosphatase [Burkholderiales bacterium 35-55-47]OYZ72466.1 MAG: UDP-2,3-diacylglucosamine diphosphatase [Burkholderiales bacterium 24-55-52]OZA99794.1 MAG: UDP-2,3-diacylglucosamine diphosphatase [Burkholderiales bacterium 39-55-53]HQR85218.1 UDP-2,3-diacylglucosamine diphosphatase [Limnohabitans sp.]HQS27373.1 UDP-2,3-diacylglucosamine diphosphatase [Limnohabitans sp.]